MQEACEHLRSLQKGLLIWNQTLAFMKASRILYILSASTPILFSGCDKTDLLEQGKTNLERQITAESNGLIKLASIRKTDGKEMEIFGVKCYELTYTATIEFTKNCSWSGGGDGVWTGRFAANEQAASHSGLEALNPFSLGQQAEKWDQKTISGKFGFEKTENDWTVKSW